MLPAQIPSEVLDDSDPGDETQRRFRYQAARAALLALEIFNEKAGIEEVYCEQQEDILVEKTDHSFIGVQVKTRKVGLGPFKATDDDVVKTLAQFVQLDREFAGAFVRFVLSTNCGFNEVKDNGANLPHLLRLASGRNSPAPDKLLRTFVKRISAVIASVDESEILSTLSKVHIDEVVSLESAEDVLGMRIAELPQARTSNAKECKKAASLLIDRMSRAASLPNPSSTDRHLVLRVNPDDERARAIIRSKKITKQELLIVLEQSFGPDLALKKEHRSGLPLALSGLETMKLKLDRGGVSEENIQILQDLKYSAEHLVLAWLAKHGDDRAVQYYDNAELVVLNACQEAFDNVSLSGDRFGTQMLIEVRERLTRRYSDDRERLHGCMYEHLLGIAGILTEECKVWWSKKFPLGEMGDHVETPGT